MKTSLIALLLTASATSALASGMKPSSPVLFLDADNREATIDVTNTDSAVALLHSSLQTIKEEPQNNLIVTPQLARVEPGKQQQVRVVLKEGVQIKQQTMQRINFVSIPTDDGKKNRARVLVGQNIPVIISPAGLPVNISPWEGLQIKREGATLQVTNPTAYIVRLTTQVDLLPGKQQVALPNTYILPQQHITLNLPQAAGNPESVRLHPVTRFGVLTTPYEIKL